MKTYLIRTALVIGVLFNGLLWVGHLLVLGVLLATASADVIIVGDSESSSHLPLIVVYLLPLAIGLSLWRVHPLAGWMFLSRVLYLTMAAFYVTALLCVIVCRVYGVWLQLA